MKTKKNGIGGCLAVVAGVMALCLAPVFLVFLSMTSVWKMERTMRDPKMFEPVGKTLALYCQSDQSLFPEYPNYAWLPPEMNAIGHGWAHVSPTEAFIEMGGGFYHYGYRVVRDNDHSTPEINAWLLYQQSEGGHGGPLRSFTLPVQAKLSAEDLFHRVINGFEMQLKAEPKDERAHQGKIQTALRFNHVPEARQACRDMLKAMPGNWWAVLTNAFILTEEQSMDRGTEFILQWVKQREDFFSYIDLAYFYHLTGRPREAARAIVKSTEFNADTWAGDGGNAEFRGYTAAICAYRAGDYEASLKLCDHLLPVKINGDYCKKDLRNLKAASENALHGQVDSHFEAGKVYPFDAFEDVDIEKLLGRKVPRPVKAAGR